MRNATILVVRLKGTATEAIKNMVLAGIGKLIIVDNEEVAEEDLGAGFLFRDEDVGKKVRFHPFRSVRTLTGNNSG
jgi:ubiquitin-like 1-activating enzyme E1 A